jgi:hypothetical protein
VTTLHPATSDVRAVSASDYEIRVKGRLSDRATDSLEDLALSVNPVATTLRGAVRDQAELNGVLDQIHALGLELIQVRRLPT